MLITDIAHTFKLLNQKKRKFHLVFFKNHNLIKNNLLNLIDIDRFEPHKKLLKEKLIQWICFIQKITEIIDI